MPESLFIYNFLFYDLFKLCILSQREWLLFLLVKSPLKNTDMSDTVERIINLILEDMTKTRSCVKDPCGVCKKTVKTEHKAILCNSCKFWSHIVCNGISLNEYENLKYKSDLWYCLVYNIKNNLDKRLHNFLEEHNILYHNQFGFRKNN